MKWESRFPVEPWHLREFGVDFDLLAQSESLFALSNGHIGLRGNFDEGEPYGLPGTYLNSFFESRPLPYAEAGYGYPESGQTIVNVTNGKVIRLLVDDEPFDMRYGEVRHHERILDLRGGRLRRVVEWISPGRAAPPAAHHAAGLVHAALDRRHPLRGRGHRPAGASGGAVGAGGQRGRARALGRSARGRHPGQPAGTRGAHGLRARRALLMHRTRSSKLRMAACMQNEIDCRSAHVDELDVHDDWARLSVATRLEPGERLTLTKFVAYGWSSQRSVPALRDQVGAALASGVQTGWDQLVRDQRDALNTFWQGADVQIDGDPAVQQAVRFALFHTFQAGGPGRAAGDRGQGAHRPGLRRARVLGHRELRAAGAHGHRAARRRRRAAVALVDARPGPATGRDRARQGCGVPVAHDPRAGVLQLLAGRHRGHARQRRHRRGRDPVRDLDRRRRLRARPRAGRCWSRRPGCGSRSASTVRTGTSTSTASPGRTSTARSSTTTSTRT